MKLIILLICLVGFCVCIKLPIGYEFDLEKFETQFVTLIKQVEELKTKNTENERRIKTFEHSVVTLKKEFSTSENLWRIKFNELRRECKNEVKTQLNVMLETNSDLREEINGSSDNKQSDKEEEKPTDHAQTNVVNNNISDTVHIRKEQRNKRQVSRRRTAFYATSSIHDIQNLGDEQNIVFDVEVTDIGNDYHSTIGTFTVPVGGTYVFSATLAGETGPYSNVYAHLDLNGHRVCEFLIHQSEQSSQMVILQLKAGDDVSIQNSNAGNSYLGLTYSSFSGFLLYEDDIEVVG